MLFFPLVAGSVSPSEDTKKALSVVSRSTYIDLDEAEAHIVNSNDQRKTSSESARFSDFGVPGTISEAEPIDYAISDATVTNTELDGVDDSAVKELLQTKGSPDVVVREKDQNANGERSKVRVPRGTRKRMKPFSTSPKKTTSVPLLTATPHDSPEFTVIKPRAHSDASSNRTSTTIPNKAVASPHKVKSKPNNGINQTLTEASVLQIDYKGVESKQTILRKQTSKKLVRTRTVAPMNRRLGRNGTQHSLNINNLQEFGNEHTGVEVCIVQCHLLPP